MSGLADTFRDLVDAMNVLGGSEKQQEEIKDIFSRTHRTLQQQFVKVVIVPILKQLAEQHRQGWVDARNANSAALAAKMLASITEDDLYLPLI